MNMLDTLEGSYFSEILPKGWDIARIMECVSNDPATVTDRQSFWNKDFAPYACENLEEFGAYVGHEIAMQIKMTRDEGRKLILILPVGPMGMYKWVVYFLKQWNVDCKHVYGSQYGRMGRSERKHAARIRSRRVPKRHDRAILRPARRAHRAGKPAQLCHEGQSAHLFR